MLRLKYIKLFAHPLFIAALLTMAIVPFLKDYFPKYIARITYTSPLEKTGSRILWGDFFNDGESERLDWFINSEGKTTFKVTGQSGFLMDQHVFNGQSLILRNAPLIEDLNKDGFPEIYSFYHRNDSLFFTEVHYGPDHTKQTGPETFVAMVPNPSGSKDYDLSFFPFRDTDKDNINELLFAVNAGYPAKPRNIFKYNPVSGRLISSPYLGATAGINDVFDFSGDGSPDYLVGQYAPGNLRDSLINGLNDQFVRLLILNHSLEPVWDSERFEGVYTGITYQLLNSSQGNFLIAVLIENAQNPSLNGKLMVYTKDKKKVAETKLSDSGKRITHSFVDRTNNRPEIILLGNDGSLTSYTPELKILRKRKIPVRGSLSATIDIDGNGENENVFYDAGEIVISSENLKHFAFLRLDIEPPFLIVRPIKKNREKGNELCVQYGNTFSLISYGFNPWFTYRFPAFALLWMLLSGFVSLVQYLQKLVLREKYMTERRVSELQLLLMRNQINPHFLFNAINSISYRLMEKNPEEANNSIIRLSRLIRSNLVTSDRFSRSLQEELEAAKVYAEIVRSQLEEPFHFFVEMAPETSLTTEVPVLIIQNYLENAIKHGIKSMGLKGEISISVDQDDKFLHIRIADNGIGRKMASQNKNKSPSTGKGIELMNQFFEEVNKINEKKIRVVIHDLTDDQNIPAGTEVLIEIPLTMKFRMYENR